MAETTGGNEKQRSQVEDSKRIGRYVLESYNEFAPLPYFNPELVAFRASLMEVPSYATPYDAIHAWCRCVEEAAKIGHHEVYELTGCPVRSRFVWEYERTVTTTTLRREIPNA
jgi:hypothetical protein